MNPKQKALTRRLNEASAEVVRAAKLLERMPPGPARVALFEPLMEAVRNHNRAEAELIGLVAEIVGGTT